jgi:hypothetical protein
MHVAFARRRKHVETDENLVVDNLDRVIAMYGTHPSVWRGDEVADLDDHPVPLDQ